MLMVETVSRSWASKVEEQFGEVQMRCELAEQHSTSYADHKPETNLMVWSYIKDLILIDLTALSSTYFRGDWLDMMIW